MSNVTHPAHYNSGKIEVIEGIEAWGFGPGFRRGNAIKYIARAGKKDPGRELEDLEKAAWYLNREIEILKAKKENREPVRPNDMNPRKEDSISATAALPSSPPAKRPDTVKTAPPRPIFEVGDFVRYNDVNGSVGKILAIRPGVRWTMYEVEWTFGIDMGGKRMLGNGSYTDAQIVPITKHEYDAVNTRRGFEE